MPRRSTVIFAATLALLSTFEPVWCLAEASPEADGRADVERPRFLKREIKRFTSFSNTTSFSRPFEVGPGGILHKSSSTSSSLTSSLDTLLTSSSISTTNAVTTSSSAPSTTPPTVPSSTQSPPKSSSALPVTSSLPISLPTIPSIIPTISTPSVPLSTPSKPVSTPTLIPTSSTSRFASPPGESSTSSPKGQDTSTSPAISSSKSSPAQESTPKPPESSSRGGQESSTSDSGILPTSDLGETPPGILPTTTRFQPPPSSKPTDQNSSPSTNGGPEGTQTEGEGQPTDGTKPPSTTKTGLGLVSSVVNSVVSSVVNSVVGGQSSENPKPTTTGKGEGGGLVSSVVGGVTKGPPSITVDVSISAGGPSLSESVIGGSSTKGPAVSLPTSGAGTGGESSGTAGSEPTGFSGIPNKPTSSGEVLSASSVSSDNSLYNALTSALQTGIPIPSGSTVLSNSQTVPLSEGSVVTSLSASAGTQPSGSTVVSGGIVPVSIPQSALTSNLIPASITVSGSLVPNTASIPVVTGGISGLSTLSNGQVVSSYGPSTLSNGVVISPGLSTLPSEPPVSISGLPISEPTITPTLAPTGGNSVNTAVPITESPGASSIGATGVLPVSVSNTGVQTVSNVNTAVSNTESPVASSPGATGVPVSLSGTSAPQTSGGSSQETTLPAVSGQSAASSNPSGSSSPVIIGSTTNSEGSVVPVTSVPPSSLPSGSTGVGSPASGQSLTASVGGSTTLSNGSVVPISGLSEATESTRGGSAASATGVTATGASETLTATGLTNSLATATPISPSAGNLSNPVTIPASAASSATPAASPSLSQSQSGFPLSSALPVATTPQSYDTTREGGTFTQQPTGYDTRTTVTVPSSIIYASSTTSPTASNEFSSTGLPSGVPLILYPPDGPVKQPPNTDLIQIGFKYPLNYDFVWTHQESQHQIFKFLPMGVAYGLNINETNCTMQTLRAWDTTQDLHYITTLALAWIPKELVSALEVAIKTPPAPLYNNPNPSVKTLMSMINPTIDVRADDKTDGGSQTNVGATPTDTGTSNNGGAPINNNNAPVRASSVGIGVGVVCGAAAYGAAMFFVARRYKKRRRSHMRSPSMFSSPVMSHAGPDPAAGTALMSGGMGGERSLSPYYDNDGRGSRGSGRSGSSAGRQQISAPVMAENSLGWN